MSSERTPLSGRRFLPRMRGAGPHHGAPQHPPASSARGARHGEPRPPLRGAIRPGRAARHDRGRPARARWSLAVCAAAGALALAAAAATPTYFPDDPLQADNDRAFDAGGAKPIEGSNAFDFAEHTFLRPGDRRDIRAVNVNTVDEVPDSTWFTNRIGRAPLTLEEIARGPNQFDSLDVNGWPIVQEKSSGITPGYRIVDPEGRLYQLKFDPPEHPEMSSGAEVVGAAIYHALGYNVVQGYIVEIDPARIVISPEATTVDLAGRRRQMTRKDVDKLLARAARQPNGRYRALASRFADGQPLGYFKYYGTRPDDPNDIHPHEHRRELRANRVFAAWLNHDDSRGLNTLDMLEGPPGRQYIRHFMFDFGSIMGSGSTTAQVPRAGNEYILEWGPALKTLATLGLYVRPWIGVDYWQGAKSVGRFEGDFFEPSAWKPEYPNPAFDNMRADDAFWGARLVAKFSDEAIRAIVARAQYSEPGAADHIVRTLIARRDKVLRTWLTGINPLGGARLDAAGRLTFENAAVAAGVADAPAAYHLTWTRFDNTAGTPVGASYERQVSEPSGQAPAEVLDSGFVRVSLRAEHPRHPVWNLPVTFTFRQSAGEWTLVGVDRETPPREDD